MSGRALDEYRRKRDPARTPEPFEGARDGGGRRFVVQKHAARRLHYDLRLEIDGVLVSWAVPRGPSTRAEDRRLAVHVEDHPVAYGDFEGIIPAGNYGAGAVIVWDRGWYRLTKPGTAAEWLARGTLEFELHGSKLRGRWTLARMGGKDRDWLLLKKADAYADDEEVTERLPESVLSGLGVEEVRDGSARTAELHERLAALGEGETPPPPDLPLMLASTADRPFSDPEWLFEIKYDGVRVLARREGSTATLRGRSGQDVTSRYPEVVAALRALPVSRFVLDGEVVAFDEEGRPSFQRLQARMHLTRPADVERASATVPATAVFFDVPWLEGHDLRRRPLDERKACLALLLPTRGVARYGDHVVEHGEAFHEAACEQRLEGTVAKRMASPYRAGRSPDWIKVKCQLRQEFVIGGWTDPRGSRGPFGALHLGLYEGDRLRYVSKVGTGFDEATLRAVGERLRDLARPTSPFDAGTPAGRGHHWVEPVLVCEVRFTDWTNDGGIRHPAFLGLRDDKSPRDCRRESPETLAALLGEPPASGPGSTHAGTRERAGGVAPDGARASTGEGAGEDGHRGAGGGREVRGATREVRITNPRKVFWPAEGYTKADLVAYYESMAPLLLPYLRDRPLVLTRYPDGIDGKSFYQKDAPGFVPSWIRTERVESHDERAISYFVVDDLETLRYVVNLGTIPLHLWGSRVGSLDRPDWLILDLDPKGAPFSHVVRMARTLHDLLDDLELPVYVKTSGATGLHLLLPMGAAYSWEETRTFARLLAMLGVEAEPEIATVARPIRSRQGKVYVDYLQNIAGQTIAAPFSARPLPGAPVSCPLDWREVNARLDPARFTLATVPARFARRGDPLAPVLGAGIDMARALERLQRRRGNIAAKR